jgi:replicative DNA helicase
MDVANKIAQIDSLSKSDSMSNVEFSRAIMEQKEIEEDRGDEKPGFRLGPMLEILDDRLAGEWPGCLGIIGGRANTGKTTLLTEMALYSVLANEDTVSVILTLDDARRKIIPRLVSLFAYEEFGNIFLNMGMVERPAHWTKQMMGNNAVYEYRDAGYKRLRELVNEGRLIVKDTTHGTSFPYIQALLQHAQHAHPDKQIMFWLDSYHKVATTDGSRDREFHVELALIIKNLAKQLSIPFWMNAEYTKLPAGTRPSNTHLAETVKLEYEADVIIHLYNDLHDIGIESDHFFTYNNKRMPLVEAIFGKNKINDFKESVWLKFYPEYGIHQAIDREQAQAILRTQEPLALEDEDD